MEANYILDQKEILLDIKIAEKKEQINVIKHIKYLKSERIRHLKRIEHLDNCIKKFENRLEEKENDL